MIQAGGLDLHVFNVYGWPAGTPDRANRQSKLWEELFSQAAGLGKAPWIMGGDWNDEPGAIWANALGSRAGGFLPGRPEREPTCFPEHGQPRELDFFLVSRSLKETVRRYDTLPRGPFPTHRPVALCLNCSAALEPVPTIRKPRSFADLLPERPVDNSGRHSLPHALDWGDRMAPAVSAQAAWDCWVDRAENWLAELCGIDEGDRGPYTGRGKSQRSSFGSPSHPDFIRSVESSTGSLRPGPLKPGDTGNCIGPGLRGGRT